MARDSWAENFGLSPPFPATLIIAMLHKAPKLSLSLSLLQFSIALISYVLWYAFAVNW